MKSLAFAVLFAASALQSFALTATVDGITWTYTVSNGKASVGDGSSPAIPTSTTGAISIPSMLGGYPVTSIESGAFAGCSGVTSITIPNSVRIIGDGACYNCTRLTTIAVPSGVTSIGNYAFYKCSGLTSITIPGSVASIGSEAFSGCSKLSSATISYWYEALPDSIRSVSIPDGVTSIGNSAFSGCSRLTSITIPDGVTSIGNSAFSGCSGLTSITIPDSVTSIGNSAFYRCSELTSITIPDSVTSIGDYAFSDCSAALHVTADPRWAGHFCATTWTIPDGVKTIGPGAFKNRSNLCTIDIPASVEHIGEDAFYGCGQEGGFQLPFRVNITDLAAWCRIQFDYPTNSSSPTCYANPLFVAPSGSTSSFKPMFSTTTPRFLFLDGVELSSFSIPDGVSSVSPFAFAGLSAESVVIPDSVESIGVHAFYGSTIQEIHCPAKPALDRVASSDFPRPVWKSGIETIDSEGVAWTVEYSFLNGCDWCWISSLSVSSAVSRISIPPSIGEMDVVALDGAMLSRFSACSGLELLMPEGVFSLFGYTSGSASRIYLPESIQSISPSWINFMEPRSDYSLILVSDGSPIADLLDENNHDVTTIHSRIDSDGNIIETWTNTLKRATIVRYRKACANGSEWLYESLPDGETCCIWGRIAGNGLPLSIPERMDGLTVVSVGNNAFSGDAGPGLLELPESIQSIGASAFAGCSNLTSIALHANVTNIGSAAFSGCSSLMSVEIPDSMSSIGSYAFYKCSGLTSITIPSSVTNIGNYAFSGCRGPLHVTANPTWTQQFSSAVNLIWTIPDGMTSIANSAFCDCYNLTSITIPDSVTSIGSSAFYGCSGLTSVFIPKSVTSIGSLAFYNCSELLLLVLPSRFETVWWVNEIPADCIVVYHTIAFSEANLPGGMVGRKYAVMFTQEGAGESASYSATGLPPGLSLSAMGVLSGTPTRCGVYTASVSAVDEQGETKVRSFQLAIANDIDWNYIEIGEDYAELIDYYEQYNACIPETTAGILVIPDRLNKYGGSYHLVTSIGDRAFYRCCGLTSVFIPDSVTSIGNEAFFGCSGLTSITIPSGITSIGSRAFSYCPALESLLVDETNPFYDSRNGCNAIIGSMGRLQNVLIAGCKNTVIPNDVTSISASAFYGCSGLTSITIPDSVKNIGGEAFCNCSGLTSLAIPAGVTSIGVGAFGSCSGLLSVSVDPNNPAYDSRGDSNAIIDSGKKELVTGCKSTIIPDSVTSIGDYAFSGCSGLSSLAIPDSVTNIGNYAFIGCSGLSSLSIPDSVTHIGDYAFFYCSGLTSVTIPDSVTSIGKGAFQDCSELTSITIPDGVTSIGKWAFDGCSGLTLLEVPDPVQQFDSSAISGCEGLRFLVVADEPGFETDELERALPEGCRLLHRSAVFQIDAECLGGGVRGIPYRGRLRTTGSGEDLEWELVDGDLPNGLRLESDGRIEGTADESGAFPFTVRATDGATGWSASGTVTLAIAEPPEGIEEVVGDLTVFQDGILWGLCWEDGSWRIVDCSPVPADLDIPSEIGGYRISAIGDCAFEGERSLRSVSIEDGVETIEYAAFRDCTRLASVALPASLTNGWIDGSAFEGCRSIRTLTAPGEICVSDYLDETQRATVSTLIVADGSARIRDCAFEGMSGLTSVVVPDGVETIEYAAFRDCTRLASVALPASLTNGWIDGSAFEGCRSIRTLTAPGEICVSDYLDDTQRAMVSTLLVADGSARIRDSAFEGLSGLVRVEIPEGVEEIEACAFAHCARLETVTIPRSLESGASDAFYDCPNLVRAEVYGETGLRDLDFRDQIEIVVIREGTRTIAEEACSGCSNLKRAEIAEGVRTIGCRAFAWCYSLESVSIPSSVTYMDDSAFEGCSIGTVTAPGELCARDYLNVDCVTNLSISPGSGYVDDGAFACMAGIRSVEMPDSVSWIGERAFECCESLESVSIPASVQMIGSDAFYGCEALGALTVPGHLRLSDFLDADRRAGVTNLALAPGTTYVEDEAFAGMAGIDRLEIPDSVTWIGSRIADGCERLRTVSIGRNVAWIDDGAFDGCEALDVVLIDDDPLFDPDRIHLPGDAQIVRRSDYFEISTATLPDATARIDYEAWLCVEGGRSDFRWEDREGLPSGLWVDSEGAIRGTPDESGVYEVRIRATAECGFWREAVLSLRIEQGQTASTPVPVPFDWIADHADSFLAAENGDCEAAAMATAANGENKVWECYVAGLDPTDAAARFEVRIEFDAAGEPVVTWEPDLNEAGTKHERVYTLEGKETLSDGWGPTNANSRFFRVKVRLPE